MQYLLIFQNSSNEYSFAYTTGFIGSANKEEALKMLPDNYNGYHAAHHTWSSSAALDWITCRQSLAEFKDFEEIESFLSIPHTRTDFGGWCGSRPGIAINKDKYAELEAKIVKQTALITKDVVNAKPFYEEVYQ